MTIFQFSKQEVTLGYSLSQLHSNCKGFLEDLTNLVKRMVIVSQTKQYLQNKNNLITNIQ